jgi:DNA-binding transcriptional LysR family regulator
MDGTDFNWALVKSFVAVLDSGSLMGAARKLGAQQPTLSRHVAELEAQLGVPLFERTGRGLTPTAAALAIAEAARQMHGGAATLQRALAQRTAASSGTVRITTSHVAASYLLPAAIARLQAAEPGIAVELVASNELTNLLRREADIAVRMVRPSQASLVARKLGDIAITVAAHASYLKRHGTPREPRELLQHRLIGYDRDPTIVRGFAAMGLPLTREHFAVRTDDHLAYGRLVAAGAARMVLDADATGDRLADAVRTVLPAEMRAEMERRVRAFGHPDAADRVVDVVTALVAAQGGGARGH